MSKILITGGTGFIGTPLVEILSQFHEVVLYKGDILDRVNLAYAFGCKPDVVIHLAGPSTLEEFKERPKYVTDVILGGTRDVVQLCKRYNIRLIYASSAGVETVNANHNVRSCYDVSKLMAETIIQDMLENYLILRIPAVYGEGMQDDRLLAKIQNNTFEYDKKYKDNIITYMMLPEFIAETIEVLNNQGIHTYKTESTTLEDFYTEHS